jgi:hypothetical protein
MAGRLAVVTVMAVATSLMLIGLLGRHQLALAALGIILTLCLCLAVELRRPRWFGCGRHYAGAVVVRDPYTGRHHPHTVARDGDSR